MFCIKCGTQIQDNAKFCSNCGHPTQASGSAISPIVSTTGIKGFFDNVNLSKSGIASLILAAVNFISILFLPLCVVVEHEDAINFFGENDWPSAVRNHGGKGFDSVRGLLIFLIISALIVIVFSILTKQKWGIYAAIGNVVVNWIPFLVIISSVAEAEEEIAPVGILINIMIAIALLVMTIKTNKEYKIQNQPQQTYYKF